MTTPRKKLIEVALPLEAINREAALEKPIRHGHPSTLHLWWARRPLAAGAPVAQFVFGFDVVRSAVLAISNSPFCADYAGAERDCLLTVGNIPRSNNEMAQRIRLYARSYCANRAAHDVAWAEEMGVF